jgi:hypothetical protein
VLECYVYSITVPSASDCTPQTTEPICITKTNDINVPGYSCKLELCQQIFVHIPVSNSTKIHPVGAKLFHMEGWKDGQTDMMKQSHLLYCFMNVPNKEFQEYIKPTLLLQTSLPTNEFLLFYSLGFNRWGNA